MNFPTGASIRAKKGIPADPHKRANVLVRICGRMGVFMKRLGRLENRELPVNRKNPQNNTLNMNDEKSKLSRVSKCSAVL